MTSDQGGTLPPVANMGAMVVTRSSEMTRGFVSDTRSASAENRRTSRRGAMSPLEGSGGPHQTVPFVDEHDPRHLPFGFRFGKQTVRNQNDEIARMTESGRRPVELHDAGLALAGDDVGREP